MNIKSPVRVLQSVPSMGHGGIEHFLMNLYRKINKNIIQFDFMYRVSYDCVFDKEIKSLGGRIFHNVDPDRHPLSSKRIYREFFAQHPEIRAVHEHRSGCEGFFGLMREARRANIPIRILHSHNSQKCWSRNPIKDLTDFFNAPRLDSFANFFIACSDVAADYLYNRCIKAKKNCIIMPNAIDLEAFAFDEGRRKEIRDSLGIPRDAFVIGHVGRFVPEKNQTFLLDVIEILRARGIKANLILLGDGPLCQDVREKAHALKLDCHVHFAGLRDETAPFYSAMDVFCMPSIFEGLPVSCIEAQASGLPLVLSTGITKMSDVCGHSEFLNLEDGANAWADALIRFHGIKRYDNSISLVAAGYDIASVAQRFETLYLGATL